MVCGIVIFCTQKAPQNKLHFWYPIEQNRHEVKCNESSQFLSHFGDLRVEKGALCCKDLWTTKAALKCRIFFKASVALETVPLSFVNTCRSFKERESSLIRRSHKVNSYCQLWKKTREITVVENYSKSLTFTTLRAKRAMFTYFWDFINIQNHQKLMKIEKTCFRFWRFFPIFLVWNASKFRFLWVDSC